MTGDRPPAIAGRGPAVVGSPCSLAAGCLTVNSNVFFEMAFMRCTPNLRPSAQPPPSAQFPRARKGGKRRYRPPLHMIKLTERQEITPYNWVHPDDER